MLAWLKAIDGNELGIILMVLTVLTLWVGNKAKPQIEGSPYESPMIEFEKAGSVAQVETFLREVEKADPDARRKLDTAIRWDYLFLFIYPALIAVGCLIVINFLEAKKLWGVMLGLILIALQPLAGLFDAVENYALLRMLGGSLKNPWPQIAKWFATVKFGIVYAGLGYMIVYGLAALIWAKVTSR
jgi:hypothetical protein